MSTKLILFATTLFSTVWAGSMFVIDTRQSARDVETRQYLKEQLDSAETKLEQALSGEIKKYENIWTLDEIIDMVNQKHVTDIQSLKKYLKEQNNKDNNILLEWVKQREQMYDTIYFQDEHNYKWRLLGANVLGKYYLMKQERVDDFPFNGKIK